ncbi:MAG: alpha/beta fold hydrolase [Planctomycetes bacterium]|nr:alpha/beta fold hydrolase [Planctomycetota bacterium]
MSDSISGPSSVCCSSRPARAFARLRAHRRKIVGAILLLVVIVPNALAFMHAWSFTHFSESGTRPRPPEMLSVLERGAVLLTGVRLARPSNRETPEDYGLDFRVHRLANSAGQRLEAWHIPCQAPRGLCILFHGYAASKASLLPEAAAFHSLGYDALLLDFRGSGGSDGAATTLGYSEAGDVAAAVQFAQLDLQADSPILFGRSMGSVAILRAVQEGMKPKAIILECPFNRLLDTVGNRFTAMGVPSFPFAEMLVFWGGVQQGYSGFDHNPVDYARAAQCPVLLLHGLGDPRVTHEQAREVFENIASEKRLVTFAGIGHEPYLAKEPDRWRSAIEVFLNDQSYGDSPAASSTVRTTASSK